MLIEAEGGLIIVDYKTDSLTEATADEKVAYHELQGASYALALETATGLTVSECRLVFCRPSGPIERAVADLPSAMARVRDRIEHGETMSVSASEIAQVGREDWACPT